VLPLLWKYAGVYFGVIQSYCCRTTTGCSQPRWAPRFCDVLVGVASFTSEGVFELAAQRLNPVPLVRRFNDTVCWQCQGASSFES
jgi:hypothetical protein